MFLDWGSNVADGKYLNIHGATATQTGYLMPYNGTIISITAKIASGNQSKSICYRINFRRYIDYSRYGIEIRFDELKSNGYILKKVPKTKKVFLILFIISIN
jgi:hypothetical protein